MTQNTGFGGARLYVMTWPLNLVAVFLLLQVLHVPDEVLVGFFIPFVLADLVVELMLRWRWPCPRCGQVFDTIRTKGGWNYFNVFRLRCIHCRYRIFTALPARLATTTAAALVPVPETPHGPFPALCGLTQEGSVPFGTSVPRHRLDEPGRCEA